MKVCGRFGARLKQILTASAACAAVAAAGSAGAQTTSGAVTPYYGKISAFYGKISAFYGKISPFYGKISPFYGDITSYWTNADPFIQTSDPATLALYGPNYDPFWGSGASNPYQHGSAFVSFAKIAPFWKQESGNWATVFNTWQSASSTADYTAVAKQLQSQIIAPADTFWDTAVSHGAKGQSAASIAKSLLEADGVTFDSAGDIDASSLSALTPTDQAMFFLDYYDRLMAFSGTGHVDWWMGAVNWSPALQQIATSGVNPGHPVTIGMLDFTYTPTGQKENQGQVLEYGSTEFSDGHGAAVQGLITGSTDGTGIMGVLPAKSANIVVYDPYDSTDTTNWTQIAKGYQTLVASQLNIAGNLLNPATVVNASLGVPGWTLNPGWNSVFTSEPLLALGLARNTVLVVAAGNDGIAQTTNVPWNFAINPALIVVGSIGVDGTISNFSNRPGTACLVSSANGACTETLASRFITAPGELILISDNSGNISRQSGTSLAAPLVTGAIGLLYARWPWLEGYADETANIILQSATKVGTNPGNDPVYGAGILNIQASQSPLDWSKLQYYPVVSGFHTLFPESATAVISTVKSGNQTTWNAQNLYFTAIETVGRTFRDFQIPLSSKLIGQSVLSAGGMEQFQGYLGLSLRNWVSGAAFASQNPVQAPVAAFAASSTPVGQMGGLQLSMQVTPDAPKFGFSQGPVQSRTDMALIGQQSTLRFGYGDGAAALDSHLGLADTGDHDVLRGGANPLLGLASGGAYVDYRLAILPRLALNVGVTDRRDLRDTFMFGITPNALANGASVYEASAEHVGLDYAVVRGLTLHGSLTRLHENSGLLGQQSIDTNDLGKGSDTTGASLGFDLAMPHGLALSASGTVARTASLGADALRTTPGGLQSSAGEVALSKYGLFSAHDRLRLSLSKLMQVDRGGLQYTTYGVVDRQTGTLGLIDETQGVGGNGVPVAAEMMYGRVFPKMGAEASFFVRADRNGPDATIGRPMDYVFGGKMKFGF